ncbi:peptidyl-tRNA hydrolase, partial [Lobosporangium transversale]
DEDEDDDKSYLIDFDTREEYKMVLVIRSDLGMGKGKAAAQCCHATLANYKDLLRTSPMTLRAWEARGQAKVTLKIDSEEEMVQLRAQARSIGLAANCIRDAGRTQIAAGSMTVLAIGPGPVSRVNSVTGKLKLY